MIRSFFIFIFCIIACKKELKYTKEKYTDIILDLQVAETSITNSSLTNKDSLRKAYHTRICEIYGFKDILELKSALEPLQGKPEIMLEITKAISIKLDQLSDSAIQQAAGKDSINRPE